MRSLQLALLLGLSVTAAQATPYTFTPSNSDLGDLDHTHAYTWGITSTSGGASYSSLVSQLTSGYKIVSATLTISSLYDWSAADTNNQLFIHLLDNPGTGVQTVTDDPTDNGVNQGVLSDYFGGKINGNSVSGAWVAYGYNANGTSVTTGSTNIQLTQFHDADGPNSATQFSYGFTDTQLATLASYISNGHTGGSSYADFGLGLDPDCHYYNTGVTLTIVTAPLSTPDSGATVLLLGAGLLSLGLFRRRTAGQPRA